MKKLTNYVWIAGLLFLAQQLQGQSYLKFSGTNAYVTFGNNSKLGLSAFTIECWFQRQGTGVTTSTGTGGVTAIPLITKGRGESDGSNVDCNYFFGINTTGNVLTADFEEGSAGSTPGLNHPISGVTAIVNNVWYHGAVTYDGSTWKLFLNGNLEATLTVSQPCQYQSIQHSAIASALTSTGAQQGFFNGALDEARIWNFAKTQAQIRAGINVKLVGAQTGMVARWGMDEGAGTSVRDTSGNAINGTIKNTGYSWVSGGAPFNINFAPEFSVLEGTSSCAKDSTTIRIAVKDEEKDTVKVKLYARVKKKAPAKFVFIGIPDTQFYTETSNGGNNEIFKAQTNWIVAQKDSLNIKHACQLGDCVQNGDNNGNDIEWRRADTSMKIIEDSTTTKLRDGIPYTMNVGNHDQSPGGDAKGTTKFFNQFFGVGRFNGRSYWGGNYGSNNDNNFQLFSANGIDFISVSLEYDTKADTNVLKWADSLLKVYSSRKAIIISHWIINSDATFGAQGSAIYNKLKVNPNLMLMLCGHINPNGEARRVDTYNGVTVHTLLSDYQDRTKGGNGWLRIMTLDPDKNSMDVKTYSPTLKQYETDANSQFIVSNLNLYPGSPFSLVTTETIADGNDTLLYKWKSLLKDTTYEWYIEVSDKNSTVKTANATFYTMIPEVNLTNDTAVCKSLTLDAKNAGNLISWSNGKTTPGILVNTSGKYKVTVTHPVSQCVAMDSVAVTINQDPVVNIGKDTSVCGSGILDAGNPGLDYLWKGGAVTRTLKVTSSGTYSVRVKDIKTGCAGYDTSNITVNPLPVLNFGKDTSICGSGILNAKNAGNQILWSGGDTTHIISIKSTGIYSAVVTVPATSCSSRDTIQMTVNQFPSVNLGKDTSTCGKPVKLNAGNTGSAFLWSDNSLLQTFTASLTGKYSVRVKNTYNCEASDTIYVEVKTIPAKPIVTGKTSYCDGEGLSALVSTGNNVVWFEDSLGVKQLGTGNSFLPVISKSTSIYSRQSLDNCQSPFTRTDIIFNPLPVVKLNLSKVEYFVNDSPFVMNGTPAGGIFKGKGVSGNRFVPSVAGIGGPYRISYIFTTPQDCTDSASTQLTVVKKITGLEEMLTGLPLIAYPNPADQNIVHFNKAISGSLFDPMGRKVATLNEMESLSVIYFSNGIYILLTDQGEMLKIVISK